ncbi:MAG TPA: DUF3037 domain-containing protein [Candidatus Acidoferrum sp.]|jgi:hypothetical protein
MPEQNNRDPEPDAPNGVGAPEQHTFIHRILRYVPSLLREEWVNIGVLVYDPITGDRRLRMIKEHAEFGRIRRVRPPADEEVLRCLRDHLESRLSAATPSIGNGGPIRSTLRNGQGNPIPVGTEWLQVLEKWDATLSNALQLAEPRATTADDINAETDRLYDELVTVASSSRTQTPPEARRTRPQMRNYMDQVFRQAGLWGRIQKNVPAAEYTLDADPFQIDYSYLRSDNLIRGFVQAISLTEKPDDVRILAPVAKRIQEMASQHKAGFGPEFLAVTNVDFDLESSDHRFFHKHLASHGVTSIPLDNFAVWVAKLRPMM